MFQRLEKMKKNAFASAILFGENNNSSISGVKYTVSKRVLILRHFGSLMGPYLHFRVLIFTILVSFTQRMSIQSHICRHWFRFNLLTQFDFYLCLRINFHTSFWVLILAAGGPYWVLNSLKNGSLSQSLGVLISLGGSGISVIVSVTNIDYDVIWSCNFDVWSPVFKPVADVSLEGGTREPGDHRKSRNRLILTWLIALLR